MPTDAQVDKYAKTIAEAMGDKWDEIGAERQTVAYVQARAVLAMERMDDAAIHQRGSAETKTAKTNARC